MGLSTLPRTGFTYLFNSLPKVLFIFRSHYLFAIGLKSLCLVLPEVYPAVRAALQNSLTHEFGQRTSG